MEREKLGILVCVDSSSEPRAAFASLWVWESGSHPGFLGLGLRDHPENSSGLLGLFVLLGKFPSTSESWLGPLAGNIWWSLAGGREAWGQGSGVCGVGVGRVWSPGTKKTGWGLSHRPALQGLHSRDPSYGPPSCLCSQHPAVWNQILHGSGRLFTP